jgi:hypothetical protein
MILGGMSRRRWRCRLTWAGSRWAQAPAPRARRAWVCPAVGIAPCWRRSPEASAEGITPQNFLSALGVSNRLRSPRSATLGTATVHGPPRSAWRAATPGGKRHAWTCSGRACARRGRRAVWSVTARPAACKTRGWAGVGQTTAESHRRWAGCQGARPMERIACLRTHAWRRNLASLRALRVSARARLRSRLASSSTVGTSTAVRSPERPRRARGTASRRSVLTRSPAF